MTLPFRSKVNRYKGIRSDAERERAATEIKFFRAAVEKVQTKKPSRRNEEFASRCEELLKDREAEICDYDALKRGELHLPRLDRLDEACALIPRIRISKGISQTELARRLGISKQVVSRYEESGYRTVGLARLQEILDILGTKIQIEVIPSE